jgi:hypothetical protein
MQVTALAGPLLVALVVQAVVRYGFGRREPIGDEVEYIGRAAQDDPFGPTPFLRVPGMPLMARLAGSVNTERRLRDMLAVLAVAVAGCVALGATAVAGSPAAWAAVLVFTFLPDRIILSQHIWPDALLALCHGAALALVAMALQGEPVSPWLFGGIAATAALARIDGIIFAPAMTLVAWIIDGRFVPVLIPVWAPTLAVVGIWTVRNAVRYGIALPDTTILFNVAILAREHRASTSSTVPVEDLVAEVAQAWNAQARAPQAGTFSSGIVEVVRRPIRFVRGFLERIWQMLGPDTFAMQRLLAPGTGAYPDLRPAARRAWLHALRPGFPVLVAWALAGAVVNPLVRVCLIPCAMAFLVICAFHARTRFRYALLPPLAVAAAAGFAALFDPVHRLAALATALLAGTILLLAPQRQEQKAQGNDQCPNDQ